MRLFKEVALSLPSQSFCRHGRLVLLMLSQRGKILLRRLTLKVVTWWSPHSWRFSELSKASTSHKLCFPIARWLKLFHCQIYLEIKEITNLVLKIGISVESLKYGNTRFKRGSISLTSWLTGLDSTKQVNLLLIFMTKATESIADELEISSDPPLA